MDLYGTFSSKRIKQICEYFDGDPNYNSVYQYRTRSELCELYGRRFPKDGEFNLSSRWMVCEEVLISLALKNQLDHFFNTMLRFSNIKKEQKDKNDEEVSALREKAIIQINGYLKDDDYELYDVNGTIYLKRIEDEADLIGEGGFARVYKIRGTNLVQKKLKDEFKNNPSIVSRFKFEYKLVTEILSNIDGVIKAYNFDEDNLSYTMDYCDTDLKKYIANNQLTENEKIDLIIKILNIMSSIHNKKVLHRDLSPKNIFIKNGEPLIADFGLGKAIDDNGRTYVTCDTSYQGTLAYCDPRQFQGLGFADEQSDIYSLGKIINYIMKGNSEDFKHTLNLVTTIATETSLDARYHSVDEMISKIKQSQKYRSDENYAEKCLSLINQHKYNSFMDNFLLSFDGEDLIAKCYDFYFTRIYFQLFYNKSYEETLINTLSTVHERLEHAIGLTFDKLDFLGYALIEQLVKNKRIGPSLKQMIGKCIFDIACGINRWNVQRELTQNAKLIEHTYVQDSLDFIQNNK